MSSLKIVLKTLAPIYFLATITTSAQAVEVAGEILEVYGVANGSLSYMDSDISQAEADLSPNDKLTDGDISVSSNNSRIGFKGRYALDSGISIFYQLEQKVSLDGSSGDTFSSRNSFFGVTGTWGEFLLGRHDTPFKTIGSKYTLFGDTVGDRRALLGSGALTGNQLDLRAENMLMWRNKRSLGQGAFDWSVLYAADAVKSSGAVDNNDRDVLGLSLQWQQEQFSAALGYDSWSDIYASQIDATRLAVKNRFGDRVTLGLLYENIRQDLNGGGQGTLDRDAYAANIAVQQDSWKYMAQVISAADYAGGADTGALMFSLGVEKTLDKSLKVYLVYTQTDNDDNAAFQAVDAGHGDELGTLPGGAPKALSAGARFSF